MSRNSRPRDVRRVAILFAVLFLVALVSRAAAVDSSLHEGTRGVGWGGGRGEEPAGALRSSWPCCSLWHSFPAPPPSILPFTKGRRVLSGGCSAAKIRAGRAPGSMTRRGRWSASPPPGGIWD